MNMKRRNMHGATNRLVIVKKYQVSNKFYKCIIKFLPRFLFLRKKYLINSNCGFNETVFFSFLNLHLYWIFGTDN